MKEKDPNPREAVANSRIGVRVEENLFDAGAVQRADMDKIFRGKNPAATKPRGTTAAGLKFVRKGKPRSRPITPERQGEGLARFVTSSPANGKTPRPTTESPAGVASAVTPMQTAFWNEKPRLCCSAGARGSWARNVPPDIRPGEALSVLESRRVRFASASRPGSWEWVPAGPDNRLAVRAGGYAGSIAGHARRLTEIPRPNGAWSWGMPATSRDTVARGAAGWFMRERPMTRTQARPLWGGAYRRGYQRTDQCIQNR